MKGSPLIREYRVMAYFSKVYAPRSYKRKVTTDLKEAKRLFEEAKDYYYGYNYLTKIVIESRVISEWEAQRTLNTTKDPAYLVKERQY